MGGRTYLVTRVEFEGLDEVKDLLPPVRVPNLRGGAQRGGVGKGGGWVVAFGLGKVGGWVGRWMNECEWTAACLTPPTHPPTYSTYQKSQS